MTMETKTIALCLSGGGYRAAGFHLGALRRLNELGVLGQINAISSVSGGSIMAAMLAEHLRPWPQMGEIIPDWEQRVGQPMRRILGCDICTWPILQKWILPWNWVRPSYQVKALARQYHRHLTPMHLANLPELPAFTFCATDLVFSSNWIFERERMGDFQLGYAAPDGWTLAQAVAASSCFPPLFTPMRLPKGMAGRFSGGSYRPAKKRKKLAPHVTLSDGGLYDNMGLEPVWKRNGSVILVSDGGAPFQFQPSRTPWRRMKRYLELIMRQSAAMRRQFFMTKIARRELLGTYWGISGSVERYQISGDQTRGYSEEIISDLITCIRTDMGRFTPGEICILENHGYLLADAAIRRRTPELIIPQPATFNLPHRDWMDEERVRKELRHSHSRIIMRIKTMLS